MIRRDITASRWQFGAPRAVAAGLASITAGLAIVIAGPISVLLLGAGIVLALVTAYLPGVLLAAYILSGIYKAAWQPYVPIDTTVVLALLCALQVVPLVIKGIPGNVSRIGLSLLVATGALYVAGILYAPDQGNAIRHVSTFWMLALLPMIPGALRVGSRPEYIRHFLWTLFALGIPMTVLGLLNLSTSERLEVFGASTIEVSRTALLVPLLGVAFVLQQRGLLARAVTLVLIPGAVVVAISSGSRGPLLALIMIGAVGTLAYFSRSRAVNWKAIAAIAIVGIGSIVAVSAFADSLPSTSISRFTLFEAFLGGFARGDNPASVGDTSSGARLALFDAAVSMFSDRPLYGFGTGGFEAVGPGFSGRPDAWPHNAILQFAAEFGIVGVSLFVALIGLGLTRRFPSGHPAHVVRVVFAFVLLNAMVSDDIYAGRPLWGLLALLFAISVPKVDLTVGDTTDAADASPTQTAHVPFENSLQRG